MDDFERCLERCDSFGEWSRHATEAETADMKSKVVTLIESIHALGVCHRDLHERNLVLWHGRPLVIDLELACAVDPAWSCYDLFGPSDSVRVAEQHLEDGLANGVWWEAKVEPRRRLTTMCEIFGPLNEVAATSGASGV